MLRFWLMYWGMAILFTIGSVLMRCWEDGGTQNAAWWTGLHVVVWVLLAIIILLLVHGPLKGLLNKMRRKIETADEAAKAAKAEREKKERAVSAPPGTGETDKP